MCLGRPATSARIPASRKRLAQFALGILDEALACAALLVQQLRDALVGVRLQETEGQVFQLPLELPDAEPVRERRVDVGAELGEFASFRFRQARRGAHPHQLPRQQDQHDAQIPDDRQQQPAQALRRCCARPPCRSVHAATRPSRLRAGPRPARPSPACKAVTAPDCRWQRRHRPPPPQSSRRRRATRPAPAVWPASPPTVPPDAAPSHCRSTRTGLQPAPGRAAPRARYSYRLPPWALPTSCPGR
jgi:hypothetical protein